ncbi:hypothetical protein BSL82_05575 [Tardibacter chloracetimidivorans]|uniref:Transglycosylase SLT domain-containing protein n=1 Tax=Tardibacter chloracetimidivorans TaxID=1921510 RepID=A0A1L3ZT77_9SPHN|nr:hypothetical protein BSL82_05575 [Tardibacter chloracetimidivorans]
MLLGLSGFALTAASVTPQAREWYRARLGLSAAPSQPPAQADPLAEAILQWDSLRQSDSLAFESYAAFLRQHPGWPGESAMRRAAERNVRPDMTSPSLVVDHFTRFPPMTNTGSLRFAEALSAMGRRADAIFHARAAWVGGTLAPDDENRLLARFAADLAPADHDSRMERLLWDDALSAAQRQISFVTPQRRRYYDARLAMKLKWPDAAARLASVWSLYPNDPGLIADKARWQRDTSDWIGARRTLAEARVAPGSVRYPLPWMKLHLDYARAAANDSQWDLAYRIAADTNAYFPGTVLRDQPYAERDVLTSLEWLAGWTAYKNLGRPASAVVHFDRYSLAAQTPQTQSKGDYWAGRAAEAARQVAQARSYYEKAGSHPDHFYGQLALEQLGRPVATPPAPQATIAPYDRSAFEGKEVVRATRLLAELGDQKRLTTFVRALADNSWNEQEQLMVAELARSVSRPDLGVRLARNARKSSDSWLWTAGYPRLPLSPLMERHWTMIHAITRQESEFYKEAVSHANARGLMQLMPGTARETAGKVGLPYDYSRLTTDTNYNIMLGSTYFANLLDRYGGNHVMAVAAYNAGPGNVNKWVAANGDPRLAGVDVIEWIEKIPIYETRNYVQRVLENAVIYDVLNPAKASMRAGVRRLSAYLGRARGATASLAAERCAVPGTPMQSAAASAQC